MKTQLIAILADIKEDQSLTHRLKDSTDLFKEIGLDSLQVVSLLMQIEDKFEIKLDIERLKREDLQSLEKLCQFLQSHE